MSLATSVVCDECAICISEDYQPIPLLRPETAAKPRVLKTL